MYPLKFNDQNIIFIPKNIAPLILNMVHAPTPQQLANILPPPSNAPASGTTDTMRDYACPLTLVEEQKQWMDEAKRLWQDLSQLAESNPDVRHTMFRILITT